MANHVEKVQEITGWHDVRPLSNHEGVMIVANIDEVHAMSGVRWSENTLVLDVEGMDGVSITFLIQESDRLVHYSTLNGRLHRTGDRPALIEYWNNRFIQSWYWYGLLHRITGPAKIECQNPTFEEDRVLFKKLLVSWFKEGCQFPEYDHVREAWFEDGWFKPKSWGSTSEEWINCRLVTFEWDQDVPMDSDHTNLFPIKINFRDFSEGQERTYSEIYTSWLVSSGEGYHHGPLDEKFMSDKEFDQIPKMFNLWGSPFLGSNTERLLIMGELDEAIQEDKNDS